MKLKNKETGEIGVVNYYDHCLQVVEPYSALCGNSILGDYRTLAELCEEWEDYEEPKECWYIDRDGRIVYLNQFANVSKKIFDKEQNEEIGNCFCSKEEAEKAVEKLKAWKRLQDKGFKFKGGDDACISYEIDWRKWGGDEADIDFELLFGGEE